MSAIIAARGNNPRFNSRRRNDGSAGRPVLRHAAWRFRRRRNQGGAAGNRRPVTRLGSAVCGQRIRLLSRGESQQTIDYSQLRSSARAEALQKLLVSADVFIANQPSLVSLQKRGIDPDSLCAKYPRLVYCSITGYGFTGPKAGMPGYDILAQAEAGLMSFTGSRAAGRCAIRSQLRT